jgi:hypothetical protein
MTNEITSSKDEFVAALVSAGLTAPIVSIIPERITPPVIILRSASPYLTPASIGTEYLLNFDLICVAATATNLKVSEKLDELIADVVTSLPGFAQLNNVGQPYSMTTGTAEYLASDVSVTIQITI